MSRRVWFICLLLVLCSVVGAQTSVEIKPLRTLTGHTDPVYAVAFSPDGKMIATGSFDKTIKLWDATTAKELRTLAGAKGHQSLVLSVDFSPTGQELATGGADNFARIWDVPSREPLRNVALGVPGVQVTVSPDGKSYAAGGHDGKVHIWSEADGKSLAEINTGGGAIQKLAFLTNNQTLVTAGADRMLRFWSATDGKPGAVLGVGPGSINGLQAHPSGNIVTTSSDGTIRVWPQQPKESKSLLEHPAGFQSAVLSTDGNGLLLTSSDKSIRWVNASTGQPIAPPVTVPAKATSLAIAPNNSFAAASLENGTVLLVGTDGKPKNEFLIPTKTIQGLVFHPNSSLIYTAGAGGLIRVANVTPPATKSLTHPDTVTALSLHSDGNRLLTGSQDKIVRLWKNAAVEKQYGGSTSAVTSVTHSRDLVAAGESNGTLRVWNESSGKLLGEIPSAHARPIVKLTIAADGQHLASTDAAGPIKIWKLPLAEAGKKNEPVATIPAQSPIRSLEAVPGKNGFSITYESGYQQVVEPTGKVVTPAEAINGKILAVARSTNPVKSVLTISTGQSFKLSIRGADNKPLNVIVLNDPVERLAISPNGSRLLAVTTTGTTRRVRLFDAETGIELQTILAPTNPVIGLAFLNDNKTIVVGTPEKTTTLTEAVVTQAFPAHAGGVQGLAMLPNGQILSTGADKTLRLWDPNSGKELRNFGQLPEVAKTLTLSRDGGLVGVATGKTIKLWQTGDGKERPVPPATAEVVSLAISSDQQSLLVGLADKTATLVNIASGQIQEFVPTGSEPVALLSHPNQPLFWVVAGKSVAQHTPALVRSMQDAENVKGGLTVVPNSNSLLTLGSRLSLSRWNLGNLQKEQTAELAAVPTAFAISQNGQLLATTSGDGVVQIYTLNNNQLAGSFKASAKILDLAFHPDGQSVVGRLADQTVSVWNVIFTPGQPLPVEFGSLVQSLTHSAAVVDVSYIDKDGQQLLTSSEDGGLRVWKIAADQPSRLFQHPNLVDCVAFDKTGKFLATACHDGVVRIFDLSQKGGGPSKEIKAHVAMPLPHPVYVIAWSPDARMLASGSYDQSIKLWDVASGNLIREIKGFPEKAPEAGQPIPPGHRDQVFCLAFSNDGRKLASGSSDRTVKLWDVATGQLLRDFPNPNLTSPGPNQPVPSQPGFVHSVKFTPDGSSLVSVGTAPHNLGSVLVWNPNDGKLKAAAEVSYGPVYSVAVSPDGKNLLLGCGPRLRTASDADAYLINMPGK